MDLNQPRITCLIMCKDEQDNILKTLDSVRGTVDSVTVYDTGSTDDTVKVVQEWATENKVKLRLKQGEFVDFASSRNVSLDFADEDTDVDFILLCDVGDELRNGELLRKFCLENIDHETGGFLVNQEWWSGTTNNYYNMRLTKARSGWRYVGRVHEYMTNTKGSQNKKKLPLEVKLYQDRTKDGGKSQKRFARDREILLEEYREDKTNTRTVFYLAQTLSCLREWEESYRYYKERSEMSNGFWEEQYFSCLKCGELCEKIGRPWEESLGWYMKAAFFKSDANRVEPLIPIINKYMGDKNWTAAFMFASQACKISYPTSCILFVDKKSYHYTRWHLMGIIAYYLKEDLVGKDACEKAIEASGSDAEIQLNSNNLKWYVERMESAESTESDGCKDDKDDESPRKGESKAIFISRKMGEIKTKNPGWSNKKCKSYVLKLWKNRAIDLR